MKMRPRTATWILLLALFFGVHAYLTAPRTASPPAEPPDRAVQPPASDRIIFKVRNIAILTIRQLVAELREARIVIIGESHDNADHHAAQLAIIQALHEAGVDVVVGFEMFRTDAQETLRQWNAGALTEAAFLEVYSEHWDRRLWPLYQPIFSYARQERLPMVGLNVPRSIVNQVARSGFETLAASQKRELGVVACDVDPKYQTLLARVTGEKGQDSAAFERFCQAQVVWDTAMALNALRYLETNPRKTLVILAGSFHAWKHGIAEQIERRSDLPVRVILPSSDDSYFNYNVMVEDADYVWWVE